MFLFAGTLNEVHRLMCLVPKLSDVKVNLGRWRPDLTAAVGSPDRMPKAALLEKAPLWKDPSYSTVRQILGSPLMTVEITEAGEYMKVDISGGAASIMVLPNVGAIPQQIAAFKISTFVIDCRGLSNEEGSLVEKLPGRSKFMDTPVIIFGGPAEVEEARKAVRKATASQWVGSTRTIEVYTDDGGGGQYTSGRKRIVVMQPEDSRVVKVPPMVNLRGAAPSSLGWTAVLGLLAGLWHTNVEEDTDRTSWWYVASDDTSLPVLMAQRLDDAPSVLFCPLHERLRLSDAASQLAEKMQSLESVPVLHWGQMLHQWNNLLPLFPPEEDVAESVPEEEAEPAPSVAQAAAKAKAARKTPAKPSVEEKEKKKRATAVAAPRPAVERSVSSTTPPEPPADTRPASRVQLPSRSRTPPTRPRPSDDTSRSHSSRQTPDRERDRDSQRDRRSPERRRSRSRERTTPRQRGPSPERPPPSRSFDVQRRGSRFNQGANRGGRSNVNERLTRDDLRQRLGRFPTNTRR